MEIALEPRIPTYAGGLGVLAGDTIRSAADLGMDMTAISLLYRTGFFRQRLDRQGVQSEESDPWRPEDRLEELPARVSIELEGREIEIRAWRYRVQSPTGREAPVYLLDTDLPANEPEDRALTADLYLGDVRHRLLQEAVLGLGGAALLRALGPEWPDRLHLNEGHAALAALALLEDLLSDPLVGCHSIPEALEQTRSRCVFTTHTPVPAGHDRFGRELARRVLGPQRTELLEEIGVKDELNMTELGLICARFVNGVAVRHGEVSRSMFPDYPIRSITNGVHPLTWVCDPMHEVFDLHIPSWPQDPFSLRYASQIPLEEIQRAHATSKGELVQHVSESADVDLDPDALTIGFARRATGYKRTALIFEDLERLDDIVSRNGPLQLVFAGKAHPRDHEGKAAIESVFRAARTLEGRVRVVYLPDYGMELGRMLVSGVDVWLNTPIPPLEASGTSGMKAAMNGVPSMSILDGWWIEGCIEGVTGWAIEDGFVDAGENPSARDRHHADSLYRKLEEVVAPTFYERPEEFLSIRRQAISLNGSFFNTHRMLLQYLHEAYLAD